MYSIIFGLVVTGGMLVMVAVGPLQGRGPAWKFVGSIVDIHLTVWFGSVGAPLTMFHDPTAYTSLQVSSCIFNGGPRRAKNTDNGDTTVKLQVPSAISSLPRLLCDAGTNLGWAATDFVFNPILNSVLEKMICAELFKDGSFAPMFQICFLQPSCTVSLLVLGNSAVLTSRKDAPSTTRLRRSTDINIVCWQANRSIPQLWPYPLFHHLSTIEPPTPPKKTNKQVSIEGGCPREKATW